MKRRRISPLLSLLCLWLLSESNAAKSVSSTSTIRPILFAWRGGSLPPSTSTSTDTTNNNATVEEYVAAMKEKDGKDRSDDKDVPSTSSSSGDDTAPTSEDTAPETPEEDNDDPAIVGVKSHSHNNKKSNAVGDPDGDDDDDSDDDSLSEYSEEWQELEEFDEFVEDLIVGEPQVHVEVELVEGEETTPMTTSSSTTGGGGVGVRLGRMNTRRRNRKDTWRSTPDRLSNDQKRLIEAWTPHLYFPPTTSALSYLSENARLLDAASKMRLDRRTLYAGLLLEWGVKTEKKLTSRTRKFLPAPASQALQAALSMATQPHWRQSAPRTSGIRLYQDEENARTSTLAMQETIVMALVSK
jgi:hypothetical protein